MQVRRRLDVLDDVRAEAVVEMAAVDAAVVHEHGDAVAGDGQVAVRFVNFASARTASTPVRFVEVALSYVSGLLR